MRFNYIYITVMILCGNACVKSHLSIDNVISEPIFSTHSVVADGSSTITISVTLNANADSNKRNVLFSASDGSFIKGKDSSISQKAAFTGEQLIAKVTWQVPIKPETVYFNIHPDLSSFSNVTRTDSVTVLRSSPAKIKLSESSFAIHYGFLSEDTLTAKLSNASGGSASSGTKVTFGDFFPSGDSVHGRFRQTSAASNASSQVSTIYSSGFAALIGTSIYVRVTVLDSTGKATNIKDSIPITIIQ